MNQKKSPDRQIAFRFKDPRGGARKGSGRPRTTQQRAHLKRPDLNGRHPLHVTWKLKQGLPSLRRRDVFSALRAAVKTARKNDLKIVHFAILSNHLHLIVETSDRPSLSRALQSLGISLAKRINVLTGGKGAIFLDRYHLEILSTPTQVRNAIHYVMTNEPLHELRNEQAQARTIHPQVRQNQVRDKRPQARRRPQSRDPRRAPSAREALRCLTFGLYSSAAVFDEWKALYGTEFETLTTAPAREIGDWLDEALSAPQTWLLKSGWKRAGALLT